MPRRIALVCMTPTLDAGERDGYELPSFGVRKIQAALLSDPAHPGHTVRLIDFGRAAVAGYVEEILDFEPDLIGFSIYIWSSPTLVEVARRIRRRRPGCVIVFGGPSARTSVFDLDFYRDPSDYLDAIVEHDGELIFREIASLPDLSRESLRATPGVTTRGGGGWTKTPKRPGVVDLNLTPSPNQMSLMPKNSVGYLETYRGCPLSCRFCEWGISEQSKVVFSADYIEREIRAFERWGTPSVYLLDAGLNLNMRAFRNLREATRRTGFLRKAEFSAEIYPSAIRDEHLEFLGEIGAGYLGVGLQSMDPAVLRLHQRPTESPRFEKSVRDLATVAHLEIQIIFGLPGDTPEGFRRTLDYALSMPASVRAFHCLVLPDALLTRGLPGWNMVFDERELSMTSCLGWSEDDILSMRQHMERLSVSRGGKSGHFWWSIPRAGLEGRRMAFA